MKKFYIVFALLISVSAKAQNITYFNYLDYSSEWYYLGGGTDFAGHSINQYVTQYFDGDSLINGMYYYKIYQVQIDSTFDLFSGVFISADTMGRRFMGCMREDNQQRFLSSNEEPFEDFSRGIGDTIFNENCVITSVQTIYLGSVPLNYCFGLYQYPFAGVAEGIGHTILQSACGIIGIEYNYGLVCYKKQNDRTCFDTTMSNINFPIALRLGNTTGIKETQLNTISLFPNLASNILTIKSDKGYTNATIAIYSITGQLVNSEKLNIQSTQNIALNKLANGLYSVLINDEHGNLLFKHKLIVTN